MYCRSSKTNGWEIYFSHVPDYSYKIWRTSENGGSMYNTKSSTKREVISAEERFYVTWCYLTGGDSYLSLASQYRIWVSTISNNVAETTLEIWNSRCRYGLMNVPENNEDWIKKKKKNFQNCLGAIDGKHIIFQNPTNSGSCIFDHKKYFSIILLVACNANYKFTIVDISKAGRKSDASVSANNFLG